jgi:translocation and assembly module TamA
MRVCRQRNKTPQSWGWGRSISTQIACSALHKIKPESPLPLRAHPFVLVPMVAAVCGATALAQDRVDDRRLARFEVPGASEEVNQTLARVLDSLRRSDVVELAIDIDDDERRLRRLRDLAVAALATEGYFEPELSVAPDRTADGVPDQARYVVKVELGRRALVGTVQIVLRGAVEEQPQRRDALVAGWELGQGSPFRDASWTIAKNRLLARVQEKDFAAARLVDSSAEVDVASATVTVRIEIDSGPVFRFGELQIEGLKHYDRNLVERFNPFRTGDRYDLGQLLDFQRRMQASPYFASAVVSVEPDPAQADAVPITVKLVEAQRKRLNFGVGYSTNIGPRFEATYRQTQIFGFPYTLASGIGIDETRAIVYSDLLLPPKPNGALDSVGGLFERSNIENVVTHRWGAGAARTRLRDSETSSIETKLSFNLQRELRRFTDRAPNDPNPASETNDVLSATYTWTRRAVDDITDPRRGTVMSLSGSAGLGREVVESLSDNTFTRAYGRITWYLPVPWLDPKTNVLVLRGEAGKVFTDDPSFIPTDFLFRTGGSGSVRSYRYQSIGRPVGSRLAGSTALAVGSIEAVHWFSREWGGAVFFDIGDAASDFDRMRQPARGAGFGVRWKTIAGPIALDLAYGERRLDAVDAPAPPDFIGGRWRLHFSVAIAF